MNMLTSGKNLVTGHLGRVGLTVALTAAAAATTVGGVVLALPSTAWASGCAGTSFNLEPPPANHVDGTACYVTSGSNIDITITLNSGTVSNVFICYAESNVDSSYTLSNQCAGTFDNGIFTAEATPSGGQTESGNPVTLTLSIVASNPTANSMQVDPGDFVYLHVDCSGSCPNGDNTSLQTSGYQVPTPTATPIADPAVAAGIVVLGGGTAGALVLRRRRRATVAIDK